MRDDLDLLSASADSAPQGDAATDADAVRAYLVQATRAPLLSAAEERDLFARIEAAQHALDRALAAHRGNPSARPVRTAARRLHELKNRVIEANLRLVISVAKRHRYSAVPLLDRIQDGNIGLIEAVDRFGPPPVACRT